MTRKKPVNPIDYIGKRFGRLVLLECFPAGDGGYRLTRCRCLDCGGVCFPAWGNIHSGMSKRCQSCGFKSQSKTLRAMHDVRRRASGIRFTRSKSGLVKGVCRCGKPKAMGAGLCFKCRTIDRLDRPIKNPVSIGTLSRNAGVTREAVRVYANRHGWEKAIERYGKGLSLGVPA